MYAVRRGLVDVVAGRVGDAVGGGKFTGLKQPDSLPAYKRTARSELLPTYLTPKYSSGNTFALK